VVEENDISYVLRQRFATEFCVRHGDVMKRQQRCYRMHMETEAQPSYTVSMVEAF
jgi:hypothetical protein